MLYVFNVDTGTMITFDMSFAVESVSYLQSQIEKICKIAVDNQVLLVSGGESLDRNARVCSYSAGTDTNPIYLFSRTDIESKIPPTPSVEIGSNIDFTVKVKESQDMPATYHTVCQRTQLAQQFHESANEELKICQNLVHEQHLQQQGWAAVIANLEDNILSFTKRSEIFQKGFEDYMNERETFLKFLLHFHEDLNILAKIPMLPVLLLGENQYTCKDSHMSSAASEVNRTCATLLDWISSTDSKSTTDQLFEHCSRVLEQYDTKIFNSLHAVLKNIFFEANQDEMKDIKGLSDRLCGLEQLMFEAKRYVKEQGDLAQSFIQNQNRASNLGDTSILPDLCASHRKQLVVMLTNHQHLSDIRRRCIKAKSELGTTLHHRLKWVMYMENLMVKVDQQMIVYHESLRRMRTHLEILQQIHLAPATYLSAVAEVVRRRAFSQAFLSWGSELACYLLTIHNDELTRRKEFQSLFENHFLSSLFSGMEDLPPSFAVEAPSIFDSNLPLLTIEDLEQLKQDLPELAENVVIPDIAAINNLFLVKSIVKSDLDKMDTLGVDEKIVQVVNEVGLGCNLDQTLLKPAESEPLTMHGIPYLRDLDRGCESETDTEEFEKVGQSPLDLHFEKEIPSPRPRTQDASTYMEVGDRNALPPRKPPRTFQKSLIPIPNNDSNTRTNTTLQSQRTLSCSGSQSCTESFTNVKNSSLESIDELLSIKNFNSNTESCFNSHHQQMQNYASAQLSHSKSLSPHTPQSPKDIQCEQLSPSSPTQGHQPNEFINDEFYIDESLPSSLSIETGQSQGEFVRQLDTANNVVALLQDDLHTSQTERDRLKVLMMKMSTLSCDAIKSLRTELIELKSSVMSIKSDIRFDCEGLTSSWENLTAEMEIKEKEMVQKITLSHELEINAFKKEKDAKEEELKTLSQELLQLKCSLENSSEELTNLKAAVDHLKEEHTKERERFQGELEETKSDKEQSLREMKETLNREHRAEIENIRTRFRLMPFLKMDRSPSDPNLEKLERFENKDLNNHEAIILHLKENYEIEKEKAVQEALIQESRKWDEKIENLRIKFEIEKEIALEEVTKRILDEKEKQIDLLREREANLNLECIKYKNTIQQLAESETSSQSAELIRRIESLERQKSDLELQLVLSKSKRNEESTYDLASSVAVCEGKVNAATSPISLNEKLTKSQISFVKSNKLSIDSCQSGDLVLILWDPAYRNFRIIQESSHLFFLHSDCLEMFGLNIRSTENRKLYYMGEVIEKDYCHAKKVGNRYNVPIGTKFFRVKVKPIPNLKEVREGAKEKSQMSQSEIAGPSTSTESNLVNTAVSWSSPATPMKQSPDEARSDHNNKMEASTSKR